MKKIIVLAGLICVAAVDTTVVPGVSRLSVNQAMSIMETAGLIGIPTEVYGAVCGYKVVGSFPKYGTVMEVGSQVQILYSSGTQTTYCEEHGLQVNHP